MKQVLSIAAVFVMFLVGCSKDVNINSPVNDQATEEFVTRDFSEESLGKYSSSKSNSTPAYTVSKVIDGSKGGLIYTGSPLSAQSGTSASIYAACYFPAGAFSGSTTITMTVDNIKLTGTFSPSMTFSKPVGFSVLFTGVNLSNYTKEQFKFVYYDKNNKKYEISSSYLYFDKVKGVLGILNAQLPHFSRYGFIRTTA